MRQARGAAHFARRSRKKDRPTGFLLTIVDGRQEGKEFHFAQSATLGRTDDNDVVIIDPGISRNHAKISGRRGVFIVEDMGSANGTRLNGDVIDGPEVLRDGDYVTVGTVNVMFSNLELDQAGEPTEQMRLTEKQAWRLDHTQHIELDLPLIKEILSGPRLVVVLGFAILWIALPLLTGRIVELGITVALVGATFGIVVWRFKPALAFLIRRPGPLAGVLAAATLVGIGMGLFIPHKKHRRTNQEWSSYAIKYAEYEQNGFNSWAMGYSRKHQYPGDQNYRDKIVFSYYKSPQRQRITLEYAACGVSEKEVAILLDGIVLGYVPESLGCRYSLKLLLPPDKLKKGDNLVAFDNLRNGPKGTETWMISYVKFREEAIPPANPQAAQQHFALAMRYYSEREVDPKNRQQAMMHFRVARDYVEEIKAKPALYDESERMMKLIERQLESKYRSGMFEAQRLVKYGKYDQAAKVLRTILAYFAADKKDPRYIRIQQAIGTVTQ